ncbi:MAG: adenylate/guanylate cyclase domain-containing protein [Spirochaetia bacterium]|nr:adenylate/guanylate cyclase domain-containing protein [Spirochaetia bacterium]
MRQFAVRLFFSLVGNVKEHSLEHRLFSTISLINGIANIFGSFAYLLQPTTGMLQFGINFITGVLFLGMYFLSRFKMVYNALYWPFNLLILIFLVTLWFPSGGSQGGSSYYLIPALMIATILSRNGLNTVMVFILYLGTSVGLLLLEGMEPAWLASWTTKPSSQERFLDVLLNYPFVQLFSAALVVILARNFHAEREKSERLLLNILPVEIADELKRNDRVQPRNYEAVSVLFTDLVGFTKIAEHLKPDELVHELDSCFTSFDSIIKKHKLEKIKTIGDSYMCAGGVPHNNRSNPVDCVLAALKMVNYMTKLKAEREAKGLPVWEIRLGIHTGHLVAGVIGQEKFAYDIWGDTVNIASRMESSGIPMQVNISRDTYELVKDFFECEYRGAVKAKNKGEIDMYLVRGVRAEFKGDDGRLNDSFTRRYLQMQAINEELTLSA